MVMKIGALVLEEIVGTLEAHPANKIAANMTSKVFIKAPYKADFIALSNTLFGVSPMNLPDILPLLSKKYTTGTPMTPPTALLK